MAKKPKLWTGERFRQLVVKLRRKGVKNPKALAAWIGMKKYGKKKFLKMAQKARKRKAKAKSKLEKALRG